jgi:hypothetical protein
VTVAAPRAAVGARRRWVALALLAVTVAAGLGAHAWLPGGAFSDITGDVLYAVAAYLAVVVVAPRLRSLVVGAMALAWCLAVELFQLTGLPLAWGAVFRPVMLVLGTVFDPRDLLVYAVTIVVVYGIDVLVRATGRR